MAGFRFTLEPALIQRRRVRDALALEFVRLAAARTACNTECTRLQDRRSETVRRLLDASGCDRLVLALDAARLEQFQCDRQGRVPSLDAEVRRARQAVTVADRAVRALEVLQASQAARYAAAVAERRANDLDESNRRGGATPE